MYPFERQMKEFKDIPINKRYIEEEEGDVTKQASLQSNSPIGSHVVAEKHTQTVSAGDQVATVSSAKPKYKHEYYQKPEEVVVTILAKGIKASSVVVDFGEQILSSKIDVPGEYAFHFQTRLFGKAEGNPGKEVQPDEVWLMGHKSKDGTARPSAQPQFNALTAKSKKIKKDDNAGCCRCFKRKVFGPHKRGGIRGKGTYLTNKRYMNAAVPKAKLNGCKDNEIASQRETINKLTSELAEVKGMLQVLMKKFLPADCATLLPHDAPININNNPSADQNAHTPSV